MYAVFEPFKIISSHRQIVQLQMDNLKELSLEAIKTNLTVSNIVNETFSQITAK
jgi:hypothetical protein